MSLDPTEPLEAARRANRALAERVAELERQLKRFVGASNQATALGGSLAEREALLSEAERIAHMGSWVWNVATNEVRWSDELFRIFGYDPATDPASFERFFARIHPDDVQRVHEISQRSITSGVSERVEFRVRRPDASIRYILLDAAMLYDERGQLQRVVGCALDVTEQREAARELEHTASVLAEAQRLGKMGSFYMNLLERSSRWSDELFRILDIEPQPSPTPELFLQCLHDDDRARIGQLIENSLRTGATEPSRARILHRNGDIRHVNMMGAATLDEHGQVTAIRGTVTDITDLVRLEAQFHQSQKMEAVGQLAGGLAHDYNNLLMVISGNAELLLDRYDCLEAREILNAARAATNLSHRLLSFSRHTAHRARVVRLRDDLELANGLIRRALGDHIAIHVELAPDLWPVYVDSGQVQQMLLNLALNARDAMPEAGTFTLIAQNTFLPEREAKHYQVSSGDYVTLEVTDSGCGMDENTRQRAFEPFFTTKPTGRGTGLGLAMVFGCMKQCGGFVELHSRPGQGSTFTLWFPRSSVDTVIRSVAPSRPPGGSARALLVEDNAAVAQVATLILESAGYEVTATRDPIAAIELWKDDPRDVLITDVEMPKLSGIRLSQRLREQSPELRTLFITAHSSEQVDLHLRPGRSAVVTKPFGRQELLNSLAELLKSK